ncbi:uncharacterized protein LOC126803833 [Argentina anserina]|uniref:uncharacterized protein LOC126803833 n=1 Tax=Argentina anserina TaxID=57926 RepID=UPI002176430E|nr:uncharacterized protein LOC126803833 [Potentilla anserina]
MGCKINNSTPPILWRISTKNQRSRTKIISFSSTTTDSPTSYRNSKLYTVKFKTLSACKLGIARYPDFEYNAEGGAGTGVGTTESSYTSEVSVSFDIDTLYIPPLQTSTTRFLGLPLPPFLKIDVVPELFRGCINQESGKVDLEFKAKFYFSVGSIYRAPPLVVETILTSEESRGTMRRGKGERLDKQGYCKLVGVATVDPIDDLFINTFLGLPTECLAGMNAVISISTS